MITFTLKIDVDTEIGTRVGIPNLLTLLKNLQIPATFYLSLGPDNTGRAIRRIFNKGFFKKCSRTSVISTYGIRTVLNGVLLPGPHIGKKHQQLLRSIKEQGFDVGTHAYDHQRWQNSVSTMTIEEIDTEFGKARNKFQRIFETPSLTAASPGWQANEKTLAIYDKAKLVYASDCRGTSPFFPKIGETTFKTLQIPTTLPTLDELLGRPEFPLEKLIDHYLSLLRPNSINVLTLHPELEGMKYLEWFSAFLTKLKQQNIQFITLAEISKTKDFPVCEMIQNEVDGRSGKLAYQGKS